MTMSSFYRLFYVLELIPKLGCFNVILIFLYRISLKIRFFLNPAEKQKKFFGDLFLPSNSILNLSKKENDLFLKISNQILNGHLTYFSNNKYRVGSPPKWLINPFNNIEFDSQNIHWSKIDDFHNNIGDIKSIWEISRFNWIGTLAIAYKINLDDQILEKINFWVNDWISKNPYNIGPNWKCGQEASLRLINIIIANQIIGNEKISKTLHYMLETHLDRIAATTFYAEAQSNNHILSESIALLLGGYLLNKNNKKRKIS